MSARSIRVDAGDKARHWSFVEEKTWVQSDWFTVWEQLAKEQHP